MSFGILLRQLRIEKRLNQIDLAEIIGVNRATIGKYETEERFPGRSKLEDIADYFHVSIDYLLGRTDIRELSNTTVSNAEQEVISEDESVEDETVTIGELLAFVKEIRNKKKGKKVD